MNALQRFILCLIVLPWLAETARAGPPDTAFATAPNAVFAAGACDPGATCGLAGSNRILDLATYTLSVSRLGSGSGTVTSTPAGIACGATCAADFAAATEVTLTAVPAWGAVFAGWGGACTGTGTCQLTMDAARNVTATFNFAIYTLTVSVAGSGRVVALRIPIDCPPTCSASLYFAQSVVLSPIPAPGWFFSGWGGFCSGLSPCSFAMTANTNVTATFSVQPSMYSLTVIPTGSGKGAVTSSPTGIDCGTTCSASYDSGTVVTLTALPGAGSVFGGWSGPCTGTGACEVTMDGAKSVTAAFDLATSIPRLANLSSRAQVLTGADVLIGGFIIGGSQAKTVVVRARGASLTAAGVPGALQNPLLQLFSGQSVIAANDDWQQATNAAALQSSGFAPAEPRESAILITLAPGAYTAIVSGVSNTTGVGIVEVFEVNLPEVPLINIATRGQVLTGADVMIGGFIIQGDAPQTVIVRARGPSLTAAGVPGALHDPVLQLFSGQTQIGVNDDWQTDANASQIQSRGFAPADPREAAILVTLQPGAYTAIVTGKNATTGVGIVEVFAQ